MSSVSAAEREAGASDHWLLSAPIPTKTQPVAMIETVKDAGRPKANGNSGTAPQSTNATKVLRAAFTGERTVLVRPYASCSMVSTQRSGSDVMVAVTCSIASPLTLF